MLFVSNLLLSMLLFYGVLISYVIYCQIREKNKNECNGKLKVYRLHIISNFDF
jgi:hypothetical protein